MWPPNALYVKNAMAISQSTCAISPATMGFLQFPQYQSQTTVGALLKHRRAAEESLLSADLSLTHGITLLFSKPTSTARDSRNSTQQTLAVFSNCFSDPAFAESEAVTAQTLGPLPLARVADLIGYDEESKPSPSARTEQTLMPS